MTFCIVANWDKAYSALGELTYPNRLAYAARHGYRVERTDHPTHWGKLAALLDAWRSADWLFWLDSDAVVTNPDISLNALVADHADKEVILSCDLIGLNSGSMLIRTAPRVRAVIERVLAHRAEYARSPWHDQTGLAYQLWTMADGVAVVPQRVLNSYPDYGRNVPGEIWHPGDFVFHCPGLPWEERAALLAERLRA